MASTVSDGERSEDEAGNDDDVDTSDGFSDETEGDNGFAKDSSEYELIQNGVGEWEEMHGNYVLRPPSSEDQQPR